MDRLDRSRLAPVFVLFLFSGATGLAYEVIWTRMLIRIFGASSFAVSTVLASYMAGFALGSYLLGRYIDRKGNPLRIYGFLELGVGLFALVLPWILGALNPLYRSLYAGLEGNLYGLSLIRFGLCFVLLLVPTTLMGGTLPVLSRFVAGSLSNLTFRVGWLYSLNTFGAVAGTFVTGFVLLPHLGMRASTLVAVAVNLAIFALAFAVSRRGREARAGGSGDAGVPSAEPPRASRTTRYERVVLAAFLATGLAALAAEVLWTRVLALVVGTTVYAFSIMLTIFLLGLALGSAVFARVAQRTRRPGICLAVLVAAIGFVVLGTMAAFNRLPALYLDLYNSVDKTWSGGLAIEFALSGLIMMLPTFLMGGTFPLVARIYATDLKGVGGRIGTAYAFNTIGSILGSFVGSFLLLEFLGVEAGMLVVCLVYLAVAVMLVLALTSELGRRTRLAASAALAAAAVLGVVFAPGWDKQLMTSGVYVYAGMYETGEGLKAELAIKRLLFYDEGPGATVSVEQTQNVRSLKIDGKVDASTSGDMITQQLIAHLPLLMHPRPDTVLVVGLGSGVSLGSTEQHPARHIDCVELLGNVVAASRLFDDYTYDCLADPRVNLILGDGRNHALLTDKQYDVIVSEPTNVWISGVGDLFTYEFFRLARERLKPGGVMSVWFHTYHMGDAELKAGIKTFVEVFPHTTMWLANESDLVLVATPEPARIDAAFLARLGDPKVAADLARVGVHEPGDVLGALLFTEDQLAAYAEGASRLHTDDNMLMEFRSGRRVLEATHQVHLTNIVGRLRPNYFRDLDPATNESAARHAEARKLAMEGTLARLRGKVDEGLRLYDRAYALASADPYVVSKYVEAHNQFGDALLVRQDFPGARAHFEKVAAAPRVTDSWVAYDGIGLTYLYEGDALRARDAFAADVELNPANGPGFARLGDALVALGDTVGALSAYEQALALVPGDYDTANNLAWFYSVRGEQLDRALELARRASAEGKQANYLDTLGWIYYTRSDLERAAGALDRAIALEPRRVESLFHLALVRQAQGRSGDMRGLLERVVELDADGEFGNKARALLSAS